ncbi:MAG TPA: cbb3-type cytochrome c oxidase subunit I [Acidimicrobiales bacterium]|nr:cbb3-type cytochrome c oxidase subunit I [Acidimicrobiales bacterium]
MTSTLTRPSPAASGDEPVSGSPRPSPTGTWLNTGDHKRLGLLFLYGGIASVTAACISAAIFFLKADAATLWTAPGSRLSAVNAAAALVIGIPALWIGVATYVTPLQIGATRLALPRLHNLALWTYFVGGALATVGFIADDDLPNSLTSSVAAAADGRGSDGAQLVIVGLLLVGIAMALAATSLLVTVLNRRAEGLRLTFLPLFSWSVLATSTVLLLASGVLVAGLVLLFYDWHYGSTLFTGNFSGARRIWEHELWLPGQPLGLLFTAAGVGIFGDVVATHARKPLVGFPVARVLAIAGPLLTLLLWAGNTSVLSSPFGPTGSLGGLLVFAPIGLSILLFLGTFKAGRPKAHPSLVFLLLFLAIIGLAKVLSLTAVFVGVEGQDAEAFRNGQITLLTFGAPLLALGAAAAHWSPKLWGRVNPMGPSAVQALLLFGGPVLLALPGYLIGLGAGDAVVPLGVGGAAVTAAGVLMFALDIASRGATSENDPYGGHTLEWATASPPADHNFDDLPDIRSAHPLTEGVPA